LVWASRYHQAFTKDQKSTPTTSEAQAVVRNKKIFDDAMGFFWTRARMSVRRKARFLRYTKILMVATVFLIVMVPLLFWQLWTMNTEGRVKGRLTYSARDEAGPTRVGNRKLRRSKPLASRPGDRSKAAFDPEVFANFDRSARLDYGSSRRH
jgi:hypothetical protein